MFTVYLIKVFGVATLAFVLELIKCYGVAINVAGLPSVRETLLRNSNTQSILTFLLFAQSDSIKKCPLFFSYCQSSIAYY